MSKIGLFGYLTAEAISLTGTRLSAIALPWFVLVETGSAAKTGLVAFCEMTPYIVVKLLGGPVIDKVGARRISVTADLLSGVVVGLVPVLHSFGLLSLGVLLGLVALAGAARAPGDAAKSSLVPDVAATAGIALERVTGMSGTVERLASTVGPALAGVIIVWLGAPGALSLDAVSFVAAGLIIQATTVKSQHHRAAYDPPQPYLTRLREGFRFLRTERLLLAISVMVGITNLLDTAVMAVVLPVWAVDSGAGPAAIGAIGTALGVTAIVGSLVATAIAPRLPRRTAFLLAFLIGGAPRIALLAFPVPTILIIAVWAASGLALGLINPILGAITYERIPRPLLGRVSSLVSTLAYAGTPIGGLGAGLLLSGIGLAPTALICAVLYFAATMLPALRPEWRDMNTREPVTAH